MEYLIPIMLVLLLVSGVVIFMVLNATKRSKPSEAQDSEDSDPKTMAASDPSPLGDTTEHAGEQSDEGHTVRDPEGDAEGEGEGGGSARGIDGGAGGAGTGTDARPESERLANAERPQV
jgi:hypothetical protein